MKINPLMEEGMRAAAKHGATVAIAYLIPSLHGDEDAPDHKLPTSIPKVLRDIYRATFLEAIATAFNEEAQILRRRFAAAPEPEEEKLA